MTNRCELCAKLIDNPVIRFENSTSKSLKVRVSVIYEVEAKPSQTWLTNTQAHIKEIYIEVEENGG